MWGWNTNFYRPTYYQRKTTIKAMEEIADKLDFELFGCIFNNGLKFAMKDVICECYIEIPVFKSSDMEKIIDNFVFFFDWVAEIV